MLSKSREIWFSSGLVSPILKLCALFNDIASNSFQNQYGNSVWSNYPVIGIRTVPYLTIMMHDLCCSTGGDGGDLWNQRDCLVDVEMCLFPKTWTLLFSTQLCLCCNYTVSRHMYWKRLELAVSTLITDRHSHSLDCIYSRCCVPLTLLPKPTGSGQHLARSESETRNRAPKLHCWTKIFIAHFCYTIAIE